MYNILLKNGMIYDGHGKAPYKGDIAIRDGKVVKIDKNIDNLSNMVIDVEGLAISPGFIDIHSHSDNSFLQDDRCESKIYQGVTTEVVGQCGSTMFPFKRENIKEFMEYAGTSSKYDREYYASTSLEEFVNKLNKNNKKTSTNLVPLIGHGALRAGVMGLEGRDASEDELKTMAEVLDREMAYGAWGLSLGLGYAPGIFANQEELNRLGEVIEKYDGIVASHMRNQQEKIMESLEEMYEINRQTGARIHISHLKMGGKKQWGRAQELIDNIKNAESQGIRVTKDMYPYTASSSGITNLLPKWTLDGGKGMAAKRFKTEERKKIMEHLENRLQTKEDGEGVYIVSTFGRYPIADDKTVYELSQELGMSMAEAVEQIIINTDGEASGIFISMAEEDVILMLKENDISIGSDGYAFPLDKSLNVGKPHPRSFGTFPKFLKLVREEKLCPLETAINRITKLPADTMGISDRGTIEEGKIADIVVFNPQTIEDKATYKNPFCKPIGIEHVIINGELAVYSGEQTEARLGQILLKANQ